MASHILPDQQQLSLQAASKMYEDITSHANSIPGMCIIKSNVSYRNLCLKLYIAKAFYSYFTEDSRVELTAQLQVLRSEYEDALAVITARKRWQIECIDRLAAIESMEACNTFHEAMLGLASQHSLPPKILGELQDQKARMS